MKKELENFNKFLQDNSCQTSLSCLIDSLENRKKTTLTFKDAVKTTELMAYYIDQLAKENKKLKAELEEADKAKIGSLNWMSDLSSFWLEQVEKLEEENKNLKEQLKVAKEKFK